MDQDQAEEGLETLERIEENIEEIRDRSATPKGAFMYGLLQGAGFLVGGIIAFILLGWVLWFFGFIPGFSYIAEQIKAAMPR